MKEKIIEIKNLSFNYPDGTQALRDINLDIYKDESIGIIGPNGSGKSTLLLQLNGILKGRGFIKILGMEIEEENLLKIREKVGIVFQDPDNQLFMPTVFEDVAFGPLNLNLNKEEINLRVKEALKIVNMENYQNRIPQHLSIGEKKRISIATILAIKPEILILDEPTSNLDPQERSQLMKFLEGLKITKIIAGHDLHFIKKLCQEIIILDKGSIVAVGTNEEIFKNRSLLQTHCLAST